MLKGNPVIHAPGDPHGEQFAPQGAGHRRCRKQTRPRDANDRIDIFNREAFRQSGGQLCKLVPAYFCDPFAVGVIVALHLKFSVGKL
jgi:hypothetical protein